MGDDIDAVVEEVLVDAYGEDEQLWAFRQVTRLVRRRPTQRTAIVPG